MSESAILPDEIVRTLRLHEGDQAHARLRVVNGTATISILSRTGGQNLQANIGERRWPDFQARLRRIYGEKTVAGPNPILAERDERLW